VEIIVFFVNCCVYDDAKRGSGGVEVVEVQAKRQKSENVIRLVTLIYVISGDSS